MGERNPIYLTSFLRRSVACQACIWGVAERLWRLLWPLDYYRLPFFHVGTNVLARGDLERISCDCVALGMVVNSIRPICFSP